MNSQFSILNSQLTFRRPAGTSRGVYTTRESWYVVATDPEQPGRWGIGECAPLPDLSADACPGYGKQLSAFCREIERTGAVDWERLRPYPSMTFGLETALRQLERGTFALWDTPFSRGEEGIPINGLIWMGPYDDMLRQVEAKIDAGFRCIKLKIGNLRFDDELDLLRRIRRRFTVRDMQLRVDANGAFSPADALDKLQRLSALDIHSIEQPIRAGQWDEMARLAAATPLPIALDEELIGVYSPDAKRRLLEHIRPQYIVLKPSLHGGMRGCNEWIAEARRLGTGWWITSALESNVGLNAIAQWSGEWRVENGELTLNSQLSTLNSQLSTLNSQLHQGLGTGGLFTENFPLPLVIRGEKLWHLPSCSALGGWGASCGAGCEADWSAFLLDWFSHSRTIAVQTSGSTGAPKTFQAEKERMVHSALQTCRFLGLKEGDTALLCMPLRYIGAKMMVVRTLACGLNLIVRKASGHPLKDVGEALDFAAMTPMQVFNSLRSPVEKERLRQIRRLIIGGGAIDPQLERELQELPNAVYSTYGMTETLSHIALRRLNGREASPCYTPLPSVGLTLSPGQTLVIDAPLLCDHPLETNDIAEINADGSFRILGRRDNVVNSGGIKIQIEEVEKRLAEHLPPQTFALTSVADPRFGEALVLLTTADVAPDLLAFLPKYERPRHILTVPAIPQAGNGKTDRSACRLLAKTHPLCGGGSQPL